MTEDQRSIAARTPSRRYYLTPRCMDTHTWVSKRMRAGPDVGQRTVSHYDKYSTLDM